eukprot:1122857-Karenia_brevis.AAC.1
MGHMGRNCPSRGKGKGDPPAGRGGSPVGKRGSKGGPPVGGVPGQGVPGVKGEDSPVLKAKEYQYGQK